MKFARSLTTTAMSMASSSTTTSTTTTTSSTSNLRNSCNTKTPLRGVVWDLDGTLTIPNLDFAKMYQRCQVDDSTTDILAEMEESMSPERAATCRQIVQEMEQEGRRTMQIMPGVSQVFTWLARQGIPSALVTRNTQATVDRFQELLFLPTLLAASTSSASTASAAASQQPHYSLDVAIPRDFAEVSFPPKPNPESLQYIVDRWQVSDKPQCVVMVGDSPENDIAFGRAVGTTTALLNVTGKQTTTQPATASSLSSSSCPLEPDFVLQHLWQLPRFLWLHMDIAGPLGTNAPLLKYDTPVPSTAACQAAAAGDLVTLQTMAAVEIKQTCPTTGNTPLIWAADAGHEDVVQFILDKIVVVDDNDDDVSNYVNVRGYLGATAVSRAACRGHATCLGLLATAKANLNVPNDKMQYPLHFAAFKQHLKCVQLLLEHGADTLVLDRKGRTPSLDTKNDEIRQLLEEHMSQQYAVS